MKKVLVVLLAATFGLAGNALAFHEGGVAPCESCHTMHNAGVTAGVDGPLVINGLPQFSGNDYLLKGSDQSSTCLNCHGNSTTPHSYHVATLNANVVGAVPMQEGPGGDFSWLTASTASDAQNLGHSIVAADYNGGMAADTALTAAPGGGDTADGFAATPYPAASLACSSCHDPHGKYRILDGTGAVAKTGEPIEMSGSYGDMPTVAGDAVGVYRLLAGAGYLPDSMGTATVAFVNNPPVAVAPSTYNDSSVAGGATVAYGSGMSEWCANCHGNILKSGDMDPSTTGTLRHPAGNGAKLTATIAANYNAYVKSGDMTGTGGSAAYLALVPFETGQTNADRAALQTLAATPGGAATTDNVMCLTCHRAHASGFEYMLRWNTDNDFLAENGAYTVTPGLTGAGQADAAYYNYPASNFASFQRNLCNKCHAKD